jgi:hypothetical protein
MNTLANNLVTREFQGFEIHVFSNEGVELAMVPELGAKIISLKNLRTGRQWLWHPKDHVHLFKNQPSDSFSTSPLAGIDECLPTILPCSWRGRQLPDHGEVWSQAWQVDEEDWRAGLLTAGVKLKTSPFFFKRTIELLGNEIRFDYQLSNLSAVEEYFIWAVHPLLRLVAGDELELPDSTRELLNGNAWIKAIDTAVPEQECAKVFARPVREAWVAIKNEAQADRLEFAWDAGENDTLGVWLSRGGWHGHHHFAIEPTNADNDSLAVAAGQKRCGAVAGHGTASWQIYLRVGR